MIYLIGQMAFWLLLVGVLCGVAGWAWHALQTTPDLDALERERERLRQELASLGEDGAGLPVASPESEREAAMLAARADVAGARVTELERALEEARDAREHAIGRIAELERERDAARAGDADALQAALARIAELERARAATSDPDPAEANARAWRLRYFESRVKYLEGLQPPAPVVDAAAGAEAERLRARVAELEAEREAAASADDRNALRWRARYLDARVRYLESPAARAPGFAVAEPPSEEDRRRAWRMRYLEARVQHLAAQETALRAASDNASARLQARIDALEAADVQARARLAALGEERDALAARIAALEAERRDLAPAEDVRRLGWRARYLDARVRHFEGLLSAAAKPVEAAPLMAVDAPEPPPAPLVPQGEEVKPLALPAARGGAPDDLTLIDGIGPKIESTLHSLGIYHFEQIAGWTPANIAWVDQYLRFRGRITREGWVGQAQHLLRGDFAPARRYLETEPA
jgi:predicted flap endonuclease-1-like 5' DNA nuclease/uncharacterized coiled-coil DUF342 family protein